MTPINFETHPSRYRHLRLETDSNRARITLKVDEAAGLQPGYLLKLNSYDLGVDIELADAINRLRFEHPEVAIVTITSATEGMFSSGANIFMLAGSDHSFKVNFCKFTNETRLAIEDASMNSGQCYLAALNGMTSGGGYELALACDEIVLIDDRRSAVSLPEIPYLGVLPGTGGLVRLTDKRKVRRDLADVFATLAEGVRGERAREWRLVDAISAPTRFADLVVSRELALAGSRARPKGPGVVLDILAPAESASEIRYRHVTLALDHDRRVAEIVIEGPAHIDPIPPRASDLGADWYPLRLFRELDDALLRLRFNYSKIGLVLIKSQGDLDLVAQLDREIDAHCDDWFVAEAVLLMKRTLKRLDLTSKSFFALVERNSCFAGSLLEAVLAADRAYMIESGALIATTSLNAGAFPMSNGLTRLQSRFLADPQRAAQLEVPRDFDAAQAVAAGLVTASPDDLDWDDELRLAIDERLALSPDALTAMEASLRFAGPETMETKIFGRLSAWQNWIFQRPNAVGDRGALKLYGRPERPQFDWRRT